MSTSKAELNQSASSSSQDMSAASDDSIENIDFGGRFARQFFNNNLPTSDTNDMHHLHMLNPATSTPIISDNSVCESGYESIHQAHRKSSTSPLTTNSNNTSPFLPIAGSSTPSLTDLNNNNCHNSNSSSSSNNIINNNNINNINNSNSNNNNLNNLNNLNCNLTKIKDATICNTPPPPTQSSLSTATSVIKNNNFNINHHHSSNRSACSPSHCNQAVGSSHQSTVCRVGNIHSNNHETNNVNISHPTPKNNSSTSITVDELAKFSAGIGLMKLIMTPDVVVRQQRSNSLFTTTAAVAPTLTATNPWTSQDIYQRLNNVDKIEKAASLHRTAASYSEPQYTWSGQLPTRSYKNPVFSCKVFIGGVPWDVTEQGIIETFGRFGPVRVQWPGKDVRQQSGQTKAGYVYLIYESERNVKALLQACTQDFGAGSHIEKYYYQLSSRRMRFKEVQVIPWNSLDSNYTRNQCSRPDMHRTVFVGALHGMLTAEGLAKIMNDLFGGVAYVGIDTDKYKYPLGSGRVTFSNQRSYMKAVAAAFIEVKCPQFNKKIQCDPYLESSECSTCHVQNGPVFCRDCLRYFCKTCWNWHHSSESLMGSQHLPLMRKKRET